MGDVWGLLREASWGSHVPKKSPNTVMAAWALPPANRPIISGHCTSIRWPLARLYMIQSQVRPQDSAPLEQSALTAALPCRSYAALRAAGYPVTSSVQGLGGHANERAEHLLKIKKAVLTIRQLCIRPAG